MKIKKGDKLYMYSSAVIFGKFDREIYVFTIKKINKKTIDTYKWGEIKIKDIGTKFFLSKKEMYKYQYDRQKEAYQEALWEISPMEKELKYLKNRIDRLDRQKKDRQGERQNDN